MNASPRGASTPTPTHGSLIEQEGRSTAGTRRSMDRSEPAEPGEGSHASHTEITQRFSFLGANPHEEQTPPEPSLSIFG